MPHGPWFQWHFDRWVMPPGAREVARSEVSPQAFVLRRNLAVQFHPELTSGMLHGWLDNGGDAQATKHGCDPEQMYADTVAEDPASRARAYALVDAFLDPDRPRPSELLRVKPTSLSAPAAGPAGGTS